MGWLAALLKPASLFFEEDFGQAETPAGKFLGFAFPDQGDAFLADFRQIDLPRAFGYQVRIDFGARRAFGSWGWGFGWKREWRGDLARQRRGGFFTGGR